MEFSPLKINLFLLLKLPAAYLTGVRVKSISEHSSMVVVRYKWVNKNPFNSMFWAVQGMASELSTGVLVWKEIHKSKANISMLLTKMQGTFSKKAVGIISFECFDGKLVQEAIDKTVKTKQGQKVLLKSKGVNKQGFIVSEFEYEWSLKLK
ncbi:MAG: thioesterase [Tenacibaculum sp.]